MVNTDLLCAFVRFLIAGPGAVKVGGARYLLIVVRIVATDPEPEPVEAVLVGLPDELDEPPQAEIRSGTPARIANRHDRYIATSMHG